MINFITFSNCKLSLPLNISNGHKQRFSMEFGIQILLKNPATVELWGITSILPFGSIKF